MSSCSVFKCSSTLVILSPFCLSQMIATRISETGKVWVKPKRLFNIFDGHCILFFLLLYQANREGTKLYLCISLQKLTSWRKQSSLTASFGTENTFWPYNDSKKYPPWYTTAKKTLVVTDILASGTSPENSLFCP